MFAKKTTAWTMAPFIAILMIAVIACSSEVDEPATSIPAQSKSIVDAFASDEPVPEDQAKQDSVDAEAAAEAKIAGDAVMASPLISFVEEPEAGSDEAAISAVMTTRMTALNLHDWQGVMDTCDPRLAKPNTPEKLELLWTQFAEPFAPAMSYNQKNASIRFFKDGSAIMESDLYAYNEPLFPSQTSNAVLDNWVNVDGKWYISNIWCHSGNLRLKQ